MRRLLPIAAAPVLSLACADLLSIEDAAVDPRLDAGGGGGGAALAASTAAGDGPSSASGSTAATAGGAGAGGSDEPLGGGGGEAAAGGAGGGEPAPCEAYCDRVLSACTGAFAVHASRDVCLAACAHLPPGEPGDTSGNTVHCRLHHAEAAPAEPSFYCPNASLGGNGTCGSNCEGLCSVAATVCTGDAAAWATDEECLAACEELPDLGTYSSDGSQGMYAGPHVQCRLFHLAAAAAEDPEVHCMHVAGAPPCAPER